MPYSYNEYQEIIQNRTDSHCPIEEMMTLFQGRWTLRVLYELSAVETIRFGELKNRITGITNTSLTATLRKLEEHELVNRMQYNEIPPHVEYSISEAGKDMYPIFIEMANWAKKYLVK